MTCVKIDVLLEIRFCSYFSLCFPSWYLQIFSRHLYPYSLTMPNLNFRIQRTKFSVFFFFTSSIVLTFLFSTLLCSSSLISLSLDLRIKWSGMKFTYDRAETIFFFSCDDRRIPLWGRIKSTICIYEREKVSQRKKKETRKKQQWQFYQGLRNFLDVFSSR